MSIWEIIIGIIGFIIIIILGCVIHNFLFNDNIPDDLKIPLSYQTNVIDRGYGLYNSYRDISGQLMFRQLEVERLRLEDLRARWMYERAFQKINSEPLPQNCKNCGAPLHSHECEYCGTKY